MSRATLDLGRPASRGSIFSHFHRPDSGRYCYIKTCGQAAEEGKEVWKIHEDWAQPGRIPRRVIHSVRRCEAQYTGYKTSVPGHGGVVERGHDPEAETEVNK